MEPKMTIADAAKVLNMGTKVLEKELTNRGLTFAKHQAGGYFTHTVAKEIFDLQVTPKIMAFQIVKGGTGKTSLVHETAVRASLYGLKVLCLDMDQQGNLTQSFDIDVEEVPVMVDLIAEGYPMSDAIIPVAPGIDLIGSRIENAIIDDVLTLKRLPLDRVYAEPLKKLKKHYDLIIIDCPPNLGQSVAAITLAADLVVAPVAPEKFALTGLNLTCNALAELEENFGTKIPFAIVVNKYEARTKLSQEALNFIEKNKQYKNKLMAKVRLSREFPSASTTCQSIYTAIRQSSAKQDIDDLTIKLIQYAKKGKTNKNKSYLESAQI